MQCGAQWYRTPSPSLGPNRSGGKGCNVLAQTIELSCIDLAILVNIGVTETHGEHAIELTAGGGILLESGLSAPCQERVLVVPPNVRSLKTPTCPCRRDTRAPSRQLQSVTLAAKPSAPATHPATVERLAGDLRGSAGMAGVPAETLGALAGVQAEPQLAPSLGSKQFLCVCSSFTGRLRSRSRACHRSGPGKPAKAPPLRPERAPWPHARSQVSPCGTACKTNSRGVTNMQCKRPSRCNERADLTALPTAEVQVKCSIQGRACAIACGVRGTSNCRGAQPQSVSNCVASSVAVY